MSVHDEPTRFQLLARLEVTTAERDRALDALRLFLATFPELETSYADKARTLQIRAAYALLREAGR